MRLPAFDLSRDHAAELIATLGGLFVVVAFVPLFSRWFGLAVMIAIIASVGYAGIAGHRDKTNWERWGFAHPKKAEEDTLYGCQFIGWLFILSVAFIIAAKAMLHIPGVSEPGWYFLWCIVQDFLFFGIVLGGLEKRLGAMPALGLTAFLFAASHYPLTGFMVLTGLTALCWGYLFQKTRWLPLVILSHWFMGVCLMG